MKRDLIQRLVNEVGDDPDQLPLLQHCLMRIWSQWRGGSPNPPSRPIDDTDYRAVKGLQEALDFHAEESYSTSAASHAVMWRGYGEPLPTITEAVFKRLTAIGRGKRERRDPAHLQELWALCGAETDEERGAVNAAINLFRQPGVAFLNLQQAELLPISLVDITHESLIRQWKRLRVWADQEKKMADQLRALEVRSKGSPLTGRDLDEARRWLRVRNPTPEWSAHYGVDLETVEEYIKRSIREEERLIRREKRRRLSTVGLILCVIALLAFFGLKWRHDEIAQRDGLITDAAKVEKELRAALIRTQQEKSATQADLEGKLEAQRKETIALQEQIGELTSNQDSARRLTAIERRVNGLTAENARLRELARGDSSYSATRAEVLSLAAEVNRLATLQGEVVGWLTLIGLGAGGWGAFRYYTKKKLR
jgi:hypothetical protein